MRSLRFLLSPRWLLLALAIVLLATATWYLGRWQFGRLDDRRERNEAVRVNEDRAPVPVEEVLAPGAPVADADEWRTVTASGEYAVEDTVVVRYVSRDDAPGVEVVVPLVTDEGPALLVDRGWLPIEGSQQPDPADVPAPPSGEVTVTGWVREGSDADTDGAEVTNGSTRLVSSGAIGAALGREVFGGYVQLREEEPEPEQGLRLPEPPELDDGPHFFYGLQWWFFGLLALGGFGYLAYDEWRRATGRRRGPPRQGRRPAARQRTRAGSGAP